MAYFVCKKSSGLMLTNKIEFYFRFCKFKLKGYVLLKLSVA